MHQEYTFRHRSACRTPAESVQEYPTTRKEYRPPEKNIENHAKLGRTKELGGETGVLVGWDLPSVGGGTKAGIQSPRRGNCLSQRRNI